MIYYTIPFDSGKNIGRYYNSFMDNLNDDEWGCFVDADTIFTTYDYGNIIEEAVKRYPEAGAFTCYTNRVACLWQIAPGVDVASNDMLYHRNFGESIRSKYGSSCIDVTKKPRLEVMSGFFFMIKKSVWNKIGKFPEKGMLGIDNALHWNIQAANEKLYLIQGLYLYHWYRNGNKRDKKHLL
jgi:GT2 family glycosyltransferase